MLRVLTATALAATLAACGTTAGGLKYSASTQQPPKTSQAAKPVAAVAAFQDSRDLGDSDKNWLGTIRGGFGNPLKTLTSDRPVADLVQDIFADGLRARRVDIDSTSPNRLTGRILTLYADQYVRREGKVEIELAVQDSQGTRKFTRTYSANRLEDGGLLATGIFASTDDLRATLERTLSEVVDKALDDPDLRGALRL